MTPFLALAAALLHGATLSPVPVAGFSAGELQEWRPQTFRGRANTSYALVQKEGRRVLQATSRNSASGLVKGVKVDLSTTPLLRWTWRVAASIPGGNGRTREGDDYAARVYVIFPSVLPWKTKALAYVWAAGIPAGTQFTNAYTANLRMVAIESGDSRAGRWVDEERDVGRDYEALFGDRPPSSVSAIGIMTDSDDTRSEATAWFGDIAFHPRHIGKP